MKYHPQTQKALNKYAKEYLQLYRNHVKFGKDTPATARWRANFVLQLRVSGNVYSITNARFERIRRLLYKTA